MRIRTTPVAVIGVALLAVTACSSNSSGKGSEAKSLTTATTPSSSESPSKQATAKEPAAAAMGKVQTFRDEGDKEYETAAGTVTVLSYQQPVHAAVSADEETGSSGYVWAALEVKVCGTEGEFTTSSQPWTLAYNDGARIEPSSSTYDDFPKPQYVEDAAVAAGDCSRGKIVFPVPGKQRPAKAIYTTQDMPTLRWSLSK
ncbi:hypothetical protein [Streptomyces mirabilis]|uniref:hypothetical protein n=1 Tax=Streptomyces mirabilis TaxID=68239 RepID=UPI0036C1E7DB